MTEGVERGVPAEIAVVGGGLAGCEAALWLARQGVWVTLYEQKPAESSPAHTSPLLAELVCSNSLKATGLNTASGLLKAEMRLLGSSLLPAADACRVAAGGALAVDRNAFSAAVTRLVEEEKNIAVCRVKVDALPPLLERGPVIVATGPLTCGPLAQNLQSLCGGMLSFYDAAAPVIAASSIDMGKTFLQNRYGREGADYLNCPMNKAEYETFHDALVSAENVPAHSFAVPPEGAGENDADAVNLYEGCVPIERLARRGADTMRFGPLRPVGLTDPATGRRPWACVQLRREDAGGAMYNMVGFQTSLRFAEQRRVFGMIPGLEDAEFVRYGVMHRNSFLNSPAVLSPALMHKDITALFFAGQITGVEGYMESAACGLLAARSALCALRGAYYTAPPRESMCGALMSWLTCPNQDFQPMGANMGLLPPPPVLIKEKKERYAALAHRAIQSLGIWRGEYERILHSGAS